MNKARAEVKGGKPWLCWSRKVHCELQISLYQLKLLAGSSLVIVRIFLVETEIPVLET